MAPADDDAVAPVRPVDLLVDAREGTVVLAELAHEEGHHVEGGPADVDPARGVGVAHGDRVVDEHELDLEGLAVGGGPLHAGRPAAVLQDDGSPAGPDVEGELHGASLEGLVVTGLLDGRELFLGDVGVLRDGGGDVGIRAFHALGREGEITGIDLPWFVLLSLGEERAAEGVEEKPRDHEAEDDEKDGLRF